MIKLKNLITEDWLTHKGKTLWYPAHTRTTMQLIYRGDSIALYPKQIESLFGKQPIQSFHVTSPDHLKTVKNILGKKRSISTFTRANFDSPLAKGKGIQTKGGGIIFYVRGNLLASRYMDFETIPDKTGRRWIEGHYITGDRMLFNKAWRAAGWEKKIYNMKNELAEIEDDLNDQWMEDDEAMPYDKKEKMVKKLSGPIVNKFIKSWFDWQNKYVQKNKKKFQKRLMSIEDKPSAWWNEILIYDTKIIDAFVLSRVTTSAITGTRPHWEHPDGKPGSVQIDLLKYVPKNKITIGTPAKFRKWFSEREGKFDNV
jgi:hypothetical protein